MSSIRARTAGATLGLNLALALAYYGAARLGLAVAIGPGQVTAVWPPSGLALAAFMVWGWRGLPGIAVGSLAVNWLGFLGPLLQMQPRALGGALVLSLGSVLQAGLAARLLADVPARLAAHPTRQTARYAVIAALACVVAASVGSITLMELGVVSPPNLRNAWITWWVGDFAGMLVVTPPLLLWLHAAIQRDPVSSLAFPILSIGLGLTLVASFLIGHMEREAAAERFRSAARTLAVTLQNHVDMAQRDLEVLQASYYKVEIDEAEFRRFTTPMLRRSPWQHNFAWLPLVTAAQRPAFERELGGEVVQLMREVVAQERVVPATPRSSFLPVRWTDPAAGHEALLGVDESGDDLRRPTIERVRATGRIGATPPLNSLARAATDRVVFTLYAPIFGGDWKAEATPEGRPLRGLVSATIDLGRLLEAARSAVGDDVGATLLRDPQAPGIAGMVADGRGPPALSRLQQAALPGQIGEGIHQRHDLRVGDRTWELLSRPPVAVTALWPSWLQFGVFAVGLAFTALLTGFVIARRHREMALQQARATLETQVTERTQDLSRTNARLQQEVHERRRAEEELRTFRWFAESAAQGLGISSLEGDVVYMNEQLRRLVGDTAWQPDHHRNLYDYYQPQARERLRTEVAQALQDKGHWTGELAFNATPETDRLLLQSIFKLRNDAGRTVYFANIVTDITERHRLEEALREATGRAEAANRAKSMFLANMSHEIRTPLNAVLGYTQLLLEDTRLDATTRLRLDAILAAGQRLLRLINDVLDLSRIEAGGVTLRPQPFDLGRELREAVALVAPRARAKGLDLSTDLADLPDTPVVGDRAKLGQAVLNLLSNAVKFSDRGRVDLRAWRDGPDVHITVADQGPGIAADELGQLFSPFRQGQAGADKGGTGLGLALSRGMAQAMGGSLTLASRPGEGTQAHLRLPLPVFETTAMAPGGAGAQARRAHLCLDPGTPCHVVVADDDEASRDVLAQALRGIGCEVSTAAHGEAALAACREAPPDIVFTDIRMPVMDGISLRQQLRDDPWLARVPVVAVTASSLAHEQRRFVEQGFDDFLAKPCMLEEVYAVLDRHCRVRFVDRVPPGEHPATEAATGAPAPLLSPRMALVALAEGAAAGDPAAVRHAMAALEALRHRPGMEGQLQMLAAAARAYDFGLLERLAREAVQAAGAGRPA